MSVEIPDKDEHRVAWAGLSMSDRRRIMRAVTKGVAVEDRKDARLAIGAADQQKRFWKWTWGLGPLLGLVLIGRPWQEVVLNIVLSTSLIVALSRWRWLRADRCQRANIELLEGPKKKRRKKPGRKRHLPGAGDSTDTPQQDRAAAGRPPDKQEWPSDRPDPNTSKAKLQRRKKRR